MKNFFKIIISLFTVFTIGCSRSNNEYTSPVKPQINNDQNDQNRGKNPETSVPIHIQKFNDLVKEIRQFTQNIPDDSKSFFAGRAYNVFLKQAYDPFSSMNPARDPQKPSQYFGIGAQVLFYKDETIHGIMAIPFKGSPAKKAGLKKGDIIIGVDNSEIGDADKENKTASQKILEDAVSKIKGPEGTKVKLKIVDFCDNQEKVITVTRGPITHSPNMLEDSYFVNTKQEEISKECLHKPQAPQQVNNQTEPNEQEELKRAPLSFEALYVPIYSFMASKSGQLCEEFAKIQLKDLQNPLSIGMIIDLRGNGGGALQEVSCMLNTIIPSTEVMVSQIPVNKGVLQNDSSSVQNIRFTEGGFFNFGSSIVSYNKNIVVLTDGRSASASEIFAGTIQEMKRGWIVGQRTFGKGTVQRVYPLQLGNGRRLDKSITTGIYTLNSGRSPQGHGIIPDFSFSSTGKPVEIEDNFVSYIDKTFFNNIQFENNVWEQNRPDELALLQECVNRDGKMNKAQREDTERNERHKQPFLADYHVELAKDILICSSARENLLEWDFKGSIPVTSTETNKITLPRQ